MKQIISFILFLFLASCGRPLSSSNSNGARGISASFFDTFSIKKNSSQQAWDASISGSLYENMKDPALASLFETAINDEDLKDLKCTNFNTLNNDEKSLFYIVFMAAIAKLESDFNPSNMTYDSKHRNWNIGLLQIDTRSAARHAPVIADSSVKNEDLKNAEFNLHTGLYILKNQINGKYRIEIKGRLLPSSSYYWEVLNSSFRARLLKAYFNNYNLLNFCEG